MDSLLKDLRYGARMLASNPGFTLVAVLSLALGIGVNTTIFSVVNAILLRPLPVKDSGQLVEIYSSESDGYPYGVSSYPDYFDFRDQNDVFSGLIAHQMTMVNYNRKEGPSELVFGEIVSGNYFDLLGIQAAVGRTFLPEEGETPGTHPVIVLGYGFWERRFNGDAGVIGRSIKLNGHAFTIVGVAADGFTGTMPLFAPNFWIPMMMEPQVTLRGPERSSIDRRGSRGLFIKGRLKPGVTLEQAQAQITTIMARLAEEYPDTNEGRTVSLLPVNDVRFHPLVDSAILPVAGLLMVVVGLVLLIACANVANMLLARASVRRREVAVRLALGASRLRLLRQLLTESVLLAMSGGILGLLLTYWATRLLLSFQPPMPMSVAIDLGVDVRVLAFTLLASLITGVAFGLAPALQTSRPDLVAALKDEAARGGPASRRFGLRNLLVVTQVAVSLVLLIAAGLFIRSLRNAQAIDPGFETESIAMVNTKLDLIGYDEEQSRLFFQRVVERIKALPGVESAAFTDRFPLGLTVSTRGLTIEGYELPPEEDELAFDVLNVGPRYFATMAIPVVAGREFTDADSEGAPGVAIITETMARSYWPGESPLGRRISEEGPDGPWLEVVGVVKDYKIRTVGEDFRSIVHFPFMQQDPFFEGVVVRTTGDPAPMVGMVRQEMIAIEPDMVFFEAKTMKENLSVVFFPVRMGAASLGVFGFLALGLAAVGLYGVIAYSVSQRTHEIGVRMALGAEAADVLKLVIRQGMAVVAVGVGLGLAGALAITWAVSRYLYGISTADPVTFGATSLILVAVALVANYIPARRGARIDPMVALRYE